MPAFQRIETPIGNYAFAEKEEKWGVVDVTNGNWLINPTYKYVNKTEIIDIDKNNRLFKINNRDGTFLLNEQGKKITKNYKDIDKFHFGVAIAQKDINEYTLINTQGKELLKNQTKKINHFQNGFASFERNGFQGFLDTLGNEIIKPIYHYVSDFQWEYAKVTQKGKNYFVNIKGDSLVSIPQNAEDLFNPLIINLKNRVYFIIEEFCLN